MKDIFAKFSAAASVAIGHPLAFIAACVVTIIWALSGFFVGFSNTWQLVINTATTVATFLVVFVIQNTQNRTSYATQLKLDELIHAVKGAHNIMINVEDMPEDEITRLRDESAKLAERARRRKRPAASN